MYVYIYGYLRSGTLCAEEEDEMSRRTKDDAAVTRQNLILAALDVFCEKGYSKTTTLDIARRIGMTRGAVYWHFDSKENVLVALLKAMEERERVLVQKEVPSMSTLDDLRAHFVQRARVVIKDDFLNRMFYFLSVQIEMSAEESKSIHEKMGLLRRGPFPEIQELLESARERGELRDGVCIGETIDVFRGLWMGLIHCHFIGFAKNEPWRSVDSGFRAIIESIRAPKEELEEKGVRA